MHFVCRELQKCLDLYSFLEKCKVTGLSGSLCSAVPTCPVSGIASSIWDVVQVNICILADRVMRLCTVYQDFIRAYLFCVDYKLQLASKMTQAC